MLYRSLCSPILTFGLAIATLSASPLSVKAENISQTPVINSEQHQMGENCLQCHEANNSDHDHSQHQTNNGDHSQHQSGENCAQCSPTDDKKPSQSEKK